MTKKYIMKLQLEMILYIFLTPHSTHGIYFEQNIFTECTRYEKSYYVHNTILFNKGFNLILRIFKQKIN